MVDSWVIPAERSRALQFCFEGRECIRMLPRKAPCSPERGSDQENAKGEDVPKFLAWDVFSEKRCCIEW
jgi:hypothetical protein